MCSGPYMPEWCYANDLAFIFLIIITCLGLMSPLLLISGRASAANQE